MPRRPSPARSLLVVALVCAGLVGPFAVNFATAQDEGDVVDLRQEREDKRRDAADVAAQLDELSAEDDKLIAAIAAIDAHITLQEARIATTEQSIADAESRAAAARDDAAALAESMDGIRDRLARRAVEVFVSPRLDTLERLNSDDLLKAELKRTYVDEVIMDEYQLIDQLRTAQAAQDDAERSADDAVAEAEAERSDLADRLDALDVSRVEADGLRREVATRIGEWEVVGLEIDAADAAIEREIRELEAELARQAAEAAAAEEARRLAEEEEARRQAEEAAAEEEAANEDDESEEDGDAEGPDAVEQPPVELGPFEVTHRPVPGSITSAFGSRVHPIFGTVRNHYGVDFAGGMGDSIVAAADGVVLRAGWMTGYGWTVVLSHGDGFSTLYAHQSAVLVEVGDSVAGGEVIGQVGSSGWSTGAHLHWEIRVSGVAVDPAAYL